MTSNNQEELESKLKRFAPLSEKEKCAEHGFAIRIGDRLACPTCNILINLSRKADSHD